MVLEVRFDNSILIQIKKIISTGKAVAADLTVWQWRRDRRGSILVYLGEQRHESVGGTIVIGMLNRPLEVFQVKVIAPL